MRRNLKSRGSFDHGPGRGVGALGGQLLFQAEVVDNVLGNGVAEEFVEVHASEARLLFGGLDIADVLVELDVVALLGVGQGSDGGLVLDFLLDDLFLEVGGVEFDQDLVGFEVLLGDLVAFFDDFEDFGSLVADPDLAFDFLGFERLDASAFEHGDGEGAVPGGKGRGVAGGFA